MRSYILIYIIKLKKKKQGIMAMPTSTSTCKTSLLIVFVVAAVLSTTTTSRAQSPLQYNFYSTSCPQAEDTVRNVTAGIIAKDPTMGAALMRMFFHDCFVRVYITFF